MVTVHESRVTGVLDGIEPRAHLPGAPVDQTAAEQYCSATIELVVVTSCCSIGF